MRLRRSRQDRDRGSVLALVPAGFLILVLLGALAVDSAVAYQGQSELHDTLEAAANDAVAAGLNDQTFYGGGVLTLDPATVAREVCRSVESQVAGSSLHRLTVGVAISGDSVEVTGSARVNAVFGRAVPGFAARSVRSSADATLSGGGSATPVTFGSVTPLVCS